MNRRAIQPSSPPPGAPSCHRQRGCSILSACDSNTKDAASFNTTRTTRLLLQLLLPHQATFHLAARYPQNASYCRHLKVHSVCLSTLVVLCACTLPGLLRPCRGRCSCASSALLSEEEERVTCSQVACACMTAQLDRQCGLLLLLRQDARLLDWHHCWCSNASKLSSIGLFWLL